MRASRAGILIAVMFLAVVAAFIFSNRTPTAQAEEKENGKAKPVPVISVLPAATGDCRFVAADGKNITLWAVRDNRLEYLDGYADGAVRVPREYWQQLTAVTSEVFARKFPELLAEVKRQAAAPAAPAKPAAPPQGKP